MCKNVKGHEFILQSSIIQLRIICNHKTQIYLQSSYLLFLLMLVVCICHPCSFFGFAIFQIAVIYPLFFFFVSFD